MRFTSPCSFNLSLLFLLTLCVVAKNITLGSNLIATLDKNDSWKSPSGDFAFGFQQIEVGKFLLAIWFDKIPEKTIIWSANGENLVQQGSKIQLTADGQFMLSDTKGDEVWGPNFTGSSSYAAMLDTGNFVLAMQNSTPLWESFNLPTDTIVPTQALQQGMSLVARFAPNNYSSGRFHFTMQSDGNLTAFVSVTQNPANPPYWASNTKGSGVQVFFNQSGSIYLEDKNGSILSNISTYEASSGNYYRAILEYDGVFRHYVYPKNSSVNAGWSILFYAPKDICSSIRLPNGGGAVCGFNSYCTYPVANDSRPTCECLPGYSYLDLNNFMNGCKQEDFVSQKCDGGQDADNFNIMELSNTDFPNGDYGYFWSGDKDSCMQACLIDCFCTVAVFRNTYSDCWKKRFPFSNGRMVNGLQTTTLVKMRKQNSGSTTFAQGLKRRHYSTLNLILTMLLSSLAFFNLVLLIAKLWGVHIKRKRAHPSRATQGSSLRSFTYKELEEATNKFAEELGKGACSTVYKGVLDNDNKDMIAVKRLDRMVKDSDKEFQAEMSAIGKINHKNLVQLLGFCNEGQHRLLVYECMSNGSLASYLFWNSRPSWKERREIAYGTARGLVYLHEECTNQIIHCDIKPQNVLLDDSLTARISDFGLAKLLKTDQTQTLTAIRGTKGYVAPEWFRNKPVTAKVDVYSFGILLLELICCRRSFEQDAEDENRMILADWAYDCYEEGRLHLLVQEDEAAMDDIKGVEKFVTIAIWCIQEDPSLRPTMKTVSQMLEGTVEVPHPPASLHPSLCSSSSQSPVISLI